MYNMYNMYMYICPVQADKPNCDDPPSVKALA